MALFSRSTRSEDLSAADAARDAGLTLVDVREPAEFAGGHAPRAVNIPLGTLADRLDELKSRGDVAFICQSGGRSGRATAAAKRAGLAARNVEGGMLAWQRAGLPVVGASGRRGQRRTMGGQTR